MNKLELEFRKKLCREMFPAWLVTIHVENHLNPGVPDLSYLMFAPDCETGWLELKALPAPKDGHIRVKIERGQHSWMSLHSRRIPAHFLILVGDTCYLIRGDRHRMFDNIITIEELKSCSVAFFDQSEVLKKLALVLISETHRGRDDTRRLQGREAIRSN